MAPNLTLHPRKGQKLEMRYPRGALPAPPRLLNPHTDPFLSREEASRHPSRRFHPALWGQKQIGAFAGPYAPWWRWGESNPRPKVPTAGLYARSPRFGCPPGLARGRAARSKPR